MKIPSPGLFSPTFRKNAGMALVVSLALIVLITAVVLAFFARATANRMVEASRSSHVEAEELAQSATDYLTSVFLQEIVTNSTSLLDSTNGNLYLPNSNTFAVPQRTLASSLASGTNFPNLLRRSHSSDSENNASSHGTATASRNGRSVGINRWNSPMLLTPGFSATNQLPNWIYVNADGSVTNSPGTNTIGRFAYTVYDTGGLLDANVAGHPSSASVAEVSSLKGTLAGADLSLIPGISDANAFVQWRNASSVSFNYFTSVTNAASQGFLRTVPGDCRIASRQDLINLARNGGYGITTNALPYLTHFTRELARPSLPINGLINMTNRYALSQLASFNNTGLTGTIPDFTYTNTLASSNTNTRPDFFQVLRSAIALTNSWETNGPASGGVFASTPAWMTSLDLRTVAIGANIIDQFAGTSLPTRILCGSDRVAGKKPLPMLMQLFLVYNISTNSGGTNVNFSVIPQVWSPFASSLTTSITASVGSGQIIVVGSSTNALSSGATITNSLTSGARPAYANSNANPALQGFFPTSVPLTNAAPTSLVVSFSDLSMVFKTESGTNTSIYSAFGSTNDIASAPLSGSITLTNAISSSSTTPAASVNDLAGKVIATSDPRTLQGAGVITDFSGTNALITSRPIGALSTYDGTITDTNFSLPTSLITSVGELGRIFRESPWRTMNFVTTNSPDKAVLDAFSAYPTPSGGVRAGVLNLNTRQSAVLAAMLSGTITTGSSILDTNAATTFATQMVSYTTNAPLTNRAQLVDLVGNNTLARSPATDPQKEVREAAVRALGEVGQTRTWNLLFDIVAQAGSFPPGSTSPETFRVQGEQRRWTHVAIDRPTAKVIDQATELPLE